MKVISALFAAMLCLVAGTAQADINDKDNHAEGVGGHALNDLQKKGKPTAAEVKKERELQKNWGSGTRITTWKASGAMRFMNSRRCLPQPRKAKRASVKRRRLSGSRQGQPMRRGSADMACMRPPRASEPCRH